MIQGYRFVAVPIAVVLMIASVLSIMANPAMAQEDEEAVERVALDEILDEPEFFIGERVRVIGEVGDVLVGNAFTLSRPAEFAEFEDEEAFEVEDDIFDEDQEDAVLQADIINELLVIYGDATDPIPSRIAEDSLVVVTGTIDAFDPDDPFEAGGEAFEDEDEGLFDDDAFDDFEAEPVIVADSIRTLAPAMGQLIEEILDDPDEWVGETVNVFGRVDESIGLGAFTLEGTEGFLGITEENLLVIGTEEIILDEVFEDSIVQVIGTVEFFDPNDPFGVGDEALDEEDEGFLFDEEDLSEFEDDPVIVAETVNVLVAEPGESIEEILDDEERFIGETVTVAGNIVDIKNRLAFAIEGESGFLGIGESNLLVIGSRDVIPRRLTEDTIVVVTGTLGEFDPDDPFEVGGADFEDEELLIGDEELDDFEDDPVIVAERVVPIVVD